MKKPSFQFYPGDYLRDAAVRALSLEARGLWIDMLCLMHQAPRRGYFELAEGVAISESQLARMVGESVNRVVNLIDEMRLTGVFSEDNGVIYSRRMVRDERKSEANTENGRKGGNPQLKASSLNRSVNPVVNHAVNGEDKAVVVSSSSSSSKHNTALKAQQEVWFDQWYPTYWKKVKPEAARKAFLKLVRTQQTFDLVMKATCDQREFYLAKETQYRPYPASWLNGKCWESDPSEFVVNQFSQPSMFSKPAMDYRAIEDSWAVPD